MTCHKPDKRPDEWEIQNNMVDEAKTHKTFLKDIVEQVQIHHHTKSCYKKGKGCRYGFPKLPSNRTIIAQPIKEENMSKFERKNLLEAAKCTVDKAKSLLEDVNLDEEMDFEDFVKAVDPNLTPEEYMYHISIQEKGKSIILKRRVKERNVNSYKKEMLYAWNANMDIQVAIDPYAVISYMVNYINKSEDSVTPFMKKAILENATKQASEKVSALKKAYLTHRQVGFPEAVYRVLPGMRLKDSNITCVFVVTGFPQNRSCFYRKVYDAEDEMPDHASDNEEDQEEEKPSFKKEIVEIEGRSGKYTPSVSVIDRYVARPRYLEQICLAQFATSYIYQSKPPKTVVFDEDGNSQLKSKQNIFNNSEKFLPQHITLQDNMGYMRLRKYPAVLRIHSSKKKDDYEEHYAEMQLYTHWRDEEEELKPNSEEACLDAFNERKEELAMNKKAIYPGDDTVDMLNNYELEKLQPNNANDTLDGQGEQENDDAMVEGIIDDPEYESFGYTGNLNQEDQPNYDNVKYKKICLPSDLELRAMTRKLVPEQMNVMRKVIHSCKEIVKSRSNLQVRPKPVRLLVHGGAGVGKSATINAVAKHAEKTLRKDGEDPNHPRVILCAFTAKAANLIGGTTIHSAFGFKIGIGLNPLSDKKRAEMRENLANVELIIIDEVSLCSAELLYKIHMRLTEVFNTDVSIPFANINIVLVGDLMQLAPVQGSYIFKTPTNMITSGKKNEENILKAKGKSITNYH